MKEDFPEEEMAEDLPKEETTVFLSPRILLADKESSEEGLKH